MALSGELKRVNGYGSGNEIEGYNKIEAKNDAKIKRQLRGFENGVLDLGFMGDNGTRVPNPNDAFALTATTNQNISIGPGIATCYGYDLVVSSLVQLDTVTPPATLNKYLFVFLEWDLSDPDSNEFNVGIWDNGTSTVWTPSEQDNLALIENGKYRMPIYRLVLATNGTITSTLNYAALGVVFRTGVELSQNANKAKDYNTTSGTIKEKFATIDNKFVDYNARLTALGFKMGNVVIDDIARTNSIKRQGNYCIINFTGQKNYGSFDWTFSHFFDDDEIIGSVPENFKPEASKPGILIATTTSGYRVGDAEVYNIKIEPNGDIIAVNRRIYTTTSLEKYKGVKYEIINFGYEAEAL